MPISERSKRAAMTKIIEEADLDSLLVILDQIDKQTRAEVLLAIGSQLNIKKKDYHVGQIRKIIKASDGEIKTWIVNAVAGSYSSGGNLMYVDLKKVSVSPIDQDVTVSIWTAATIRKLDLLSVQKDAVNALISDVYLDFGNSMNGLIKGAEHQINDAMKRQIRAQQIAGQITGVDLRVISKEIQETLGQQGFSVLTDKGGNQWSLRRYSDMLARTHIVKSANEGAIARALEFGVDLLEISTHAGACASCTPYEGNVYSISGDSEKYPKLVQSPPFHPHCRHSLLPRPFLSEVEQG